MNDYILYNELGRGSHTTIYKGRKKGQIDFVAICSYEKEFQSYVQNKVSILSQATHPNIVQFYEWYETSSHFWVIEELCNGCSLAMVMGQDVPVPETVVRDAAIQLTQALHHVHTMGIVVRNLHPQKVFVNAKGHLKLGGFLMGCDLSRPAEESVTPALSPLYCSPEALLQNTWSYASDLWSLGAILFHMFTGREPFPGSTLEEITAGMAAEQERRAAEGDGGGLIPVCDEGDPTATKHLTLPGCGVDGAPISEELHHLLSGLLHPDPEKRLSWRELESHPYFIRRNDLVHASFFSQGSGRSGNKIRESRDEDITDSLNRTVTLDKGDPVETLTTEERELSQGEIVLPQKGEEEEEEEDELTEHMTESMVQMPEISIPEPKPEPPKSTASRKITPTASSTPLPTLELGVTLDVLLQDYQTTIIPQPIVGNPKVFKEPVSMRCDMRLLPWQPLPTATLLDCESAEVSHHLVEIADFLSKKTVSAKEMASCVGYLYNLSQYENCVYLTVNSELLLTLSFLVKSTSEDVQLRIVQLIGALVQNSTVIEPETRLGECVSVLTDVLRDSSKSVLLRQYTLATLGELIFFIASQEETDGVNPAWSIPSSTFVCITRCLREGEELTTQLCAAKIIENVCSVQSQHIKSLTQDHIALSLWKLQMKQSPTDSAHSTFVRALANTTLHEPLLFAHVVTKIGLVNVLENLNKSQPFLQKEILLFFIHGLKGAKPNATCKRVMSQKNLLTRLIALLGGTHAMTKSLAALLITMLVTTTDGLTNACEQKLVQCIDKELKRTSEGFPARCLGFMCSKLLSFIPAILDQVEGSLRKVEGRRNPNSAQMKELSVALPSLPTLLHLLISRALGPHALTATNMEQLCDLLKMVPAIQSGETGVGSHTEDTVATFLSLAELCLPAHCPVQWAVPAVGALCRTQGEYKGVGAQLCARVTERAVSSLDTETLGQLYNSHVLPTIQGMLLENSPLPTLGMKIVLPVARICPQISLEDHGVVTALVELLRDSEGGLLQLLLETLALVMTSSSADFPWLYTLGVPELLCLAVLKLGVGVGVTEGAVIAAVSCLAALLNYVKGVVKRALQSSNKSSGEDVLRSSRCVVNTCGVLLVWYQICPNAAPATLLQIVQLYGGEYRDFLTPYNVDIIAAALLDGSDEIRKTTLKILKRIISSDPGLLSTMLSPTRDQLNTALQQVKHSSPTLVSLADEVSKLLFKKG